MKALREAHRKQLEEFNKQQASDDQKMIDTVIQNLTKSDILAKGASKIIMDVKEKGKM